MARSKNGAPARNAAPSRPHAAPDPAPAPDAALAPAGPAAAVMAALTASPGATAAGIAAAAHLSRAAAGKALAALETAGQARRTSGGRPGIPDTWHPAGPARPPARATTPASPASPDTGTSQPPEPAPGTGDHAGDNAGEEPGGPDTGQPDTSPAPEAGQDDAAAAGEDGAAGHGGLAEDAAPPDGGTGAAPDPAVIAAIGGNAAQIAAAAAAVTAALAGGDLRAALAGVEEITDQAGQARRALKAAAGGRKAPAVKAGALRELVAGHLRAHPGTEFTPHQIAKVLSRSSGAVANALDRLVSLGDAEPTSEKPRRFRLAGGAPAGQPDAVPAGDDAEMALAGAA